MKNYRCYALFWFSQIFIFIHFLLNSLPLKLKLIVIRRKIYSFYKINFSFFRFPFKFPFLSLLYWMLSLSNFCIVSSNTNIHSNMCSMHAIVQQVSIFSYSFLCIYLFLSFHLVSRLFCVPSEFFSTLNVWALYAKVFFSFLLKFDSCWGWIFCVMENFLKFLQAFQKCSSVTRCSWPLASTE